MVSLNGSLAAGGHLDMQFAVKYGPLPFHLTERYTPIEGAPAGLFIKRAQVPGGRLLSLKTVVVDVDPVAGTFTLFSCAELGALLPPLTELVVASRARLSPDATVAAQLALALRLGVPFAAKDVKRVSCANAPVEASERS